MNSFAPIRFAAIASFVLAASTLAQTPHPSQTAPASPQLPSTLPPTPATTQIETPAPAPTPIPLTPSQLPPNRAQVTYSDGALSISADNASLNQILRQISTDTGMKITGGVKDERVFGKYGPAPTDEILSALLDGTGSNMILVHGDGPAPSELILTPRMGGPTPPNPNSSAFNDRSESRPAPQPQVERSEQPVTPAPIVSPITPASPGASNPTNSDNSSQPQSPNGVKTPQQIYEELQRMRQAQQRQQQQQQQSKPQ